VFDIAFSELVVIGIVMLVVIGPKRLPEVARAAGRWAGRIRRFVEDVKRDMDVELRRDELAELRKVKDQLSETKQLFEQTAAGTFASLASIQSPETPAPVAVEPAAAPDRGVDRKTTRAVKRKSSTRKSATSSRAGHGRATRKRR
jgi:sec-independent protein translocase protein TatB